ncbi:hypothetical protein OHAE_729 [Ochrobactrum soli]|uniref:Uncharacterized protein n=1 Tax=Ochrobactrum soli TaxID=2448455 RepID=A0A2P9HLA4_9HYPH|nr:hypothetical protein OHAE_729 [[Ochrobactrum] soli]
MQERAALFTIKPPTNHQKLAGEVKTSPVTTKIRCADFKQLKWTFTLK